MHVEMSWNKRCRMAVNFESRGRKFRSCALCDYIQRHNLGSAFRLLNKIAYQIQRLELGVHHANDGRMTEKIVNRSVFDYPIHCHAGRF